MSLAVRVIYTDGQYKHAYLADRTLPSMYEIIDCTSVDVVRLVEDGPGRAGLDMWLDDDGLGTQEPNPLATALTRALMGEAWQVFHGPVILSGVNSDGDTIALSEIQADILDSLVPRLWETLKSELPAS